MKSEYPKVSMLGNVVFIAILTGLGFYFFGGFGAVGGFMLGVIIVLGGPGGF